MIRDHDKIDATWYRFTHQKKPYGNFLVTKCDSREYKLLCFKTNMIHVYLCISLGSKEGRTRLFLFRVLFSKSWFLEVECGGGGRGGGGDVGQEITALCLFGITERPWKVNEMLCCCSGTVCIYFQTFFRGLRFLFILVKKVSNFKMIFFYRSFFIRLKYQYVFFKCLVKSSRVI